MSDGDQIEGKHFTPDLSTEFSWHQYGLSVISLLWNSKQFEVGMLSWHMSFESAS